jgi:hypothetical protein
VGSEITKIISPNISYGYIHLNTKKAMDDILNIKKIAVDPLASSTNVPPTSEEKTPVAAPQSLIPVNNNNNLPKSVTLEILAVTSDINAKALSNAFQAKLIKPGFIFIRDGIGYADLAPNESVQKLTTISVNKSTVWRISSILLTLLQMAVRPLVGEAPYYRIKLCPIPKDVTAKKIMEDISKTFPDIYGPIVVKDKVATVVFSDRKIYEQALKDKVVKIQNKWVHTFLDTS